MSAHVVSVKNETKTIVSCSDSGLRSQSVEMGN